MSLTGCRTPASTQPFWWRVRAVVAVLLVSLIALRAIWLSFLTMAVMAGPSDAMVHRGAPDAMPCRFEHLRPFLPSRGVIGYIDAHRQDHYTFGMAQYGLAPLVLDNLHDHPIAVAKFPDDAALEAFLERSDFVSIKRVGGGLAVVERTGR